MSSEEDDYMSPKFLTECIKDVRPGLINNRARERQIEVTKKKHKLSETQKEESKRKKHSNQLQESLSQPIASTNKGYELLSKMGYKQGEALGKNNKGIIEPITISVKSDRSGFGREAALNGLIKRKQEIIKKRNDYKKNTLEQTTEEFRKRIGLKAEERLLEIAIRKCQSACEKLDEKEQIEKPAMDWFWPKRFDKEPETDDQNDQIGENDAASVVDEDEYDSNEKLEMLTYYMRTTYCYCHWCGIHYQNIEDLEENCPGLNKNDH